MNMRSFLAIAAVLAFTCAVGAQDAASASPVNQNSGSQFGGGYGPRGGRGGFGGGMVGRGLLGTVTEVAADHYNIKTESGDVFTINFTANTHIMKQPAGMRGPGGRGQGAGRGSYGGGTPPREIKASDIRVGDAIDVVGEIDATARSAAATRIMYLDPETAKRMEEMEADFGKTWLQGTVTAIEGTKIIVTGTLDNAAHTVVADENTDFHRRRTPITLADIQIGDMVRAEGSMKDGVFFATLVSVGGMRGQGVGPGGPRSAPPQ
jgi:Domain of unknown function (DUF5666)